jgi:diacylglycerol O-acyltransferase
VGEPRIDGKTRDAREKAETSLSDLPPRAMRSALGISPEAVGLPSALIKTLNKSVRNETSALALYARARSSTRATSRAPRTIQ